MSFIVGLGFLVLSHSVAAAPVADCNPAEAGNLLWQAGEKDPAFHSIVAQLSRWGYGAESTCIVAREESPDHAQMIYTIEQRLRARPDSERRTRPSGEPTVKPPYFMRTRIAVAARDQVADVAEFSVSRR